MRIRDLFTEAAQTKPKVRMTLRRLPDDIYQILVGGVVVGWAQVDLHRKGDPENVRRIHRVNVKKDYRRKGIATKLYDVIERELADQDLVLLPSRKGLLSDDAYLFWKTRRPEALADEPERVIVPERALAEAVTKKDLVLYHGTESEPFDSLDVTQAAKGDQHYNPLGQGLYATDSVHFAAKFGRNVHRVIIPAGSTYKRITMRQWAGSVGRNIVMSALKQALAARGIDLGRKGPPPRDGEDWDATDDAKAMVRDFYAELPEILGGAVPYKGLKDAADAVANHFGAVVGHEVRQALPAVSNSVFSAYDFVIFTDTLDSGTGQNGKSALEVVITNPALQRAQAMSFSDRINASMSPRARRSSGIREPA